jgi:hypothetical protein
VEERKVGFSQEAHHARKVNDSLVLRRKKGDFAIWIIPLFVKEMYLLVHKNGHSQKIGVSEKGGYEKVLR